MVDVGLFDGSFTHQLSSTLGGENATESPKHINWCRDRYLPVTFFTDMCLEYAYKAPSDTIKIAWLIEPPSLSDTHYSKAIEMRGVFDYVMTFNKTLLNGGYDASSFLYYPLGGSWIPKRYFRVQKKSKLVSIIGTDKRRAPGHKARRAAVGTFLQQGRDDDVMGRGYKPINTKILALGSYAYSVVIESIRLDGYFSEKLIDCLSQGTIPIYWGCSDIGEYFDEDGIIVLDNIDDLGEMLGALSHTEYDARLKAVKRNLKFSKTYRCAEDWIYMNYPYLFELC